jgi:hypothetical protein
MATDSDESAWRKLNEHDADRLFSHALHEDGVFNDRLNFFLVFESVLLATFAALYASERDISAYLMVGLAIVGMFITFLWGFVQRHQRLMLKVLVKRSKQNVLEYAETKSMVDELRGWNVSALTIMTYLIPGAVLVMWLLLAVLGANRTTKPRVPPCPQQSSSSRTRNVQPN